MRDEPRYFSVRLSDSLIRALDRIVELRNAEVGVKTWSRNKLIEKAIKDYYAEELSQVLEVEGGQQIASEE